MADTSSSVEMFKRMAASVVIKPDLPFPKIPPTIKAKFPDLTPYWDQWEKEIELWVKSRQTN